VVVVQGGEGSDEDLSPRKNLQKRMCPLGRRAVTLHPWGGELGPKREKSGSSASPSLAVWVEKNGKWGIERLSGLVRREGREKPKLPAEELKPGQGDSVLAGEGK